MKVRIAKEQVSKDIGKETDLALAAELAIKILKTDPMVVGEPVAEVSPGCPMGFANPKVTLYYDIINPSKSAPGKNLPAAITGQRYLILEDVPNNSYWGIVNARANDIIQYNGSTWTVSFDSTSNSNAVVLNTTTSLTYEWRNGQWISAVEGTYQNGWWRLYL